MKQNKNKGESKWIGPSRQKQRGKQTDMKQGSSTHEISLLPDGDPNAKESYSGSPQSSCGDGGSQSKQLNVYKQELQQRDLTLGRLLDTHFNERPSSPRIQVGVSRVHRAASFSLTHTIDRMISHDA